MPVDIRKPLKEMVPHLLKAQEENLNEAGTVHRLYKVFGEVLGYDMEEITSELQVKDKYVDLALKIEGTIKVLVEAKAAGISLNDRFIEQAKSYAAEGNYPWILLTNGIAWNLYHLSFGEGIKSERAFTVDLASDPIKEAADRLSLLHRQSIQKGELDTFWQHRVALSPESIGDALFTWEVLSLIRRNIHKKGILTDVADLTNAIYEMLSKDVQERIGSKPTPKRKTRSVK